MTTKGNGKTIQWLRDHVDYNADYCLVWPYNRNPNGYGQLGYLSKTYYAHRLMCEMAHGPAPDPEHEAAHSCGNGHGGCANPKHLSWKTRSGNLLDCREHGTQVRNIYGSMGRLTGAQVQEIRDLKGKKTQAEIAAIYGIHEPSVRDIFLGRTYNRVSKIKYYTPEEDEKLRSAVGAGLNFTQIAKLFPGRTVSGIMGHAYRIGLTSGQPVQKTMP